MNQPLSDYHFSFKDSLVGAQMMFVAFGALVLVPLLTGLDPNVALFTAGAGTLIFQAVTKRMVPIFLASSFAFIAPIIHGVKTWGIPGTLCGLAAAGVLYMLLSIGVKFFGSGFLKRILPPIVVGPVIMVIGLILAPVAVDMAIGKAGDAFVVPKNTALIVSMITLLATVFVSLLAKGMLRLVPILAGILIGYIVSIPFGLIDLSPVVKAPWIAVPSFVFPQWNPQAILFIVPVAIAPAIEFGHHRFEVRPFGDGMAVAPVGAGDPVLVGKVGAYPGCHRLFADIEVDHTRHIALVNLF